MAAVQMYPQTLRRAVNMPLTGAPAAVPATAQKKYQVMSDIAAADLADATLWVSMGLEVETAAGSGVYAFCCGAKFQCGPYTTPKTGVVVPAGANRGFQVDAVELAGKNVRFVGECRQIPAGTTNDAALGGWNGFPFHDITMGVTREALQ